MDIEGIPNSSTTLTSQRDIPKILNSSTISRPSPSQAADFEKRTGSLHVEKKHPPKDLRADKERQLPSLGTKEERLLRKNKQKEERAGTSSLHIHPTVPVSDDLYQLTLPQFSVDPSVLVVDRNVSPVIYHLPRTTEEAKIQIDVEQRMKQDSLLKGSSFVPNITTAKNNLKRPLWNRQEEGSSAKRPKKLDHLKLLGRTKKAAIKKSDVASKSSPSTSNMGSKQRRESLEESPTIVNLKFPPSSALPSIANLKARLVRFGPLIVDQIKVYWKTHSCQVMFKYKTDALEACSHIRKNNLFGQVEVACTCSAEEFGLRCSQTEPMRQHLEAWRPPRSQQPVVPPKSILKQPSDNVTRKKKRSASGKEKLRVKFRLPIDDSVLEQPPPPYDLFESEQLPLLPQNANQLGESQQCQLMQQYDGNVEGENNNNNVDISQQLLSLLHRNYEIVNSLLEDADARR